MPAFWGDGGQLPLLRRRRRDIGRDTGLFLLARLEPVPWRGERARAAVHLGRNVLKKEVDVADGDAEGLGDELGACDAARCAAVCVQAHHGAEEEHDPGQVWRAEDKDAEEGEVDVRVAARPNVDERVGEHGAQEAEQAEVGAGDEQAGAEQKQRPEVLCGGGGGGRGGGRAWTAAWALQRGLLQRAAVADQKVEVEEEVHVELAKVHEACQQAPVL